MSYTNLNCKAIYDLDLLKPVATTIVSITTA